MAPSAEVGEWLGHVVNLFRVNIDGQWQTIA